MRAILLPAEEPAREVELPDDSQYEKLRELVGGDIEALAVGGRDDATAYGFEEAKLVNRRACPACGTSLSNANVCRQCGVIPKEDVRWVEGLAENDAATALVYGEKEAARERGRHFKAMAEEHGVAVIDIGQDDPREPYIAGPIVVCGFNWRTGENRPIPDDLADELLKGATDVDG